MDRRIIGYGAVGTACLLIGAAAFFYFESAGTPAAQSPPQSATPPQRAPRTPPPPAAEPTPPTAVQTDQVLRLVGEARRQASTGNFTAADAALEQAEKVIPGQAEIATARNEIARMRTPEGQLALHLQRARLAIEHDDADAAEKALAEAEKLNAQAPEIAQLRQQLKAVADRRARRANRIGDLLETMREAIARRDFAAADAALNNAERIDVQHPDVRRARAELRRAHDADRTRRDEERSPPK